MEGHLYRFPVRVDYVPVPRRRVVVRSTVQVVRRHHVDGRENTKEVFRRDYVHIHVNACMGHLYIVPEQNEPVKRVDDHVP